MPSRLVTCLATALVALTATMARAGDTRLSGDIDGDGRSDYVTLDHREPQQLRVWLSTTAATTILHSRSAIHAVVLFDIDGDSRPELVARSAARHLNIWTRTAGRFGKVRPRTRSTDGHAGRPQHRFDDSQSDSTSDDQWTGRVASACPAQARPRAPSLRARVSRVCSTRSALRVLLAAPLAPRPPPSTL